VGGEWVTAALVVAELGAHLAAEAPAEPVKDVLAAVVGAQDEAGLRSQLDALDSQLADRDAYLQLASNLEDFLA
jgi:hypothetical protein